MTQNIPLLETRPKKIEQNRIAFLITLAGIPVVQFPTVHIDFPQKVLSQFDHVNRSKQPYQMDIN